MRYLMFVCVDEDPDENAADAPDIDDWIGYVTGLGAHVMGDRIRPRDDAKTVRVRNGKRLVTDGPFTESKEWIAGFDVLECESLDQAVEIAARHPMAYGGRIEVRPFWPLGEE